MVREGALWMRVMNMETRWELWRLGPSSPSNDASQSVIRPIREKNKADIEIAVSVTKKCVLHVFEPDKSDVNWPRLYQSS